MRRLRVWTAALLVPVLSAAAALAETLEPPSGEVVLTVSGAISVTNAGDRAELDLAQLSRLGTESFTTTTIWTEGEATFTGVPLHALLERLGAEGSTLRAVALNDYAVEIPVSDARPGGPILAYERDGARMGVRDKGPLWVLYPYDAAEDYRTEVIYARSIWQLAEIEVLP